MSAVLAGVLLLVAAGLLLVFFVTENETADRISNWFFALFYIAMMWTIVETHQFYVDAATWIWAATVTCGLALILLLITTLMVASGGIGFERVALAQTLGFGVVVIWMLSVSILILAKGGLPDALGWFGIAIVSLTLITLGYIASDNELMRGERRPGSVINALMGLILVGLTTWIIWLGLAPTTSV